MRRRLTLGAYFAMWLNTTFGLDFYTTLIPTAILSGLLSVATYLVVFRPAKRRDVGTLEMIIISFGLSIFLRYGLQFVFGSPVRFFDVPPPDTISVLGVGVTSFRLVAVVSVATLSLLLYLFIQRTSFGLQIRALASDERLAQVSGIRPLVVTVMIWFLAGVAGGLAGAFIGVGSSVDPLLGWHEFLFILLVVLVGGALGTRGRHRRGAGHRHRAHGDGAPFGQVLVRPAHPHRRLHRPAEVARSAAHSDGEGVARCPLTGWTPS